MVDDWASEQMSKRVDAVPFVAVAGLSSNLVPLDPGQVVAGEPQRATGSSQEV